MLCASCQEHWYESTCSRCDQSYRKAKDILGLDSDSMPGIPEVVGELDDCGGGLHGRAFGGWGRKPAGGCSGKAIFHTVMSMHDHSIMVTAEAFNQRRLS